MSSVLRRVAFVVALVLGIGLLAGLASALASDSSPTPSGDQKVVLQFGWFENIDSLNPFIGYAAVAYAVYYENYDTLVNYDAKTLQPIPGIAESWEHSSDGKTWTFHIRHGVKWQDGQPLTARDVAFTFNYVVDNDMGAFTTYTNALKHTTAIDDYTVQMECSKPKAGILQMWVPILPEHIWGKIDPDDAGSKYQNKPPIVGSGAFQVVEFKKDSFVRMVANKDYWGGAPKIDELIFRFYANQDTMVQDFRAGAIQWAEIPQAQFASLQNTSGVTAIKAQADEFENLGINCYTGPSLGNPVLRDPAFRRALNWAIDRGQMADVAWGGGATPATGFLPTGFWTEPLNYHWEPPADQKYTYDLDRARQELDAAGYRDTDGDGVREGKDGRPIKLRLWAIAEKNEYTAAAKLITSSLEQIGLQVKMQTMEDGAASAGMYNTVNGEFKPDYDLFIWGWTGDFDPGFLLSIFLTNQINSWSDCAWSNAEYDALFKQQDSELDPQKRKELIWRMQQIVYDQSPYVVLVYPQNLEVFDTAHWEGWVQQPAGTGTVQNNWTYLNVRPKTAVATESGGGSNWIVAVVVAVIVVVALVVWLLRRRRGGPVEES
jgi:peptide/nickel transport system substrate-binding protein